MARPPAEAGASVDAMEPEIDPIDSESLNRRISEVCREYEDASRTGRRPRPEDFLSRVPESIRQRLLRRLLMLDVPTLDANGDRETTVDPSAVPSEWAEPPSTVPDDDFLWNLAGQHLAPGSEGGEVSTEPAIADETIGASRLPERRPVPKIPGYKIVEELGRGSMGVVYLALQIDLARVCALKMILAGEYASEELARRFLTEAQTVARLRHENVVQIYGLGHHEGCPFVELEYVEGGPLSRKLGGIPWEPNRAARLVRSLAIGIAAAHREGIVHRDLKPGNILVGAGETPKIADFGLAKTIEEDSGLTQSGAILGTPSYMAPEQAGGNSKLVGPPADIYAMGAILYELLTGRAPFRGASILQTLEQVRTAEPVAPSRLQPGLPKDLDTICLKCLEKEPSRRYPDAGALAEDLRRHLAREPILARPVGQGVRLALWARRNPRVAGLTGAVAALLLVVTLGSVIASWNIASARRIGLIRQISQALRFGEGLVERRNVAGSLPWYVESLRLDEGDDDRRAIHRLRIASALQGSPRPVRTFSPDGPVDRVVYRDDARLALVVSGGLARVWDVSTGLAASPEMKIPGFDPTGPSRSAAGAFHPSGDRVLTACGPEARIWEIGSGRAVPIRLDEPITSATFSPDGALCLVTAGPRAFIFESASGRPAIPGPLEHLDLVRQANFSPDGSRIVTAWGGPAKNIGGAWIWDLKSPTAPSVKLAATFANPEENLAETPLHADDVDEARFSPDGRLIVTASYDKRAVIWDAARGSVVARLDHQNPVRLARFSPEGDRVLTASGNEARVWDVNTGGIVLPPLVHRGPVLHAAFSPDGRRIATAGFDQSARVWDAGTGLLARPLLTHKGRVDFVAFSPDGRFVATASSDRTARVWDLASGVAPVRTVWHPGAVAQAHLDPGGTRAVSIARDGTCKVWEVGTGRLLGPVIRLDSGGTAAAIDPAGAIVAVSGVDGLVEFRDVRTGDRVGPGRKLPETVTLCEFSPDGRSILAVSGNQLQVWDWRKGSPPTSIRHGDRGSIRHAAFRPDGLAVVSAGDDGTARVWDSASGRPLAGPFGHAGTVHFAAFGPEGSNLIVTASADRSARVWDLGAGTLLATFHHNDEVRHASFSPDGALVVTASTDRTARVWDARTGEAAGPLLEHEEPVLRAIFNPDGRLVATGSGGRVVGDVGVARIWEAASGDPVTLPMRHGDGVVHLAFDPSGRSLLTVGGRDSTVRVWSIEPIEDPIDRLAEIAEVYSGARIDRLGTPIPVRPDQLALDHARLAAIDPAIFSASPGNLLAWAAEEAAALEAAKRWEPALKSLDVLVAANPDDETLLGRRGRVLGALGLYDRARVDFEKIVKLGTQDDLLLSSWATLVARAGDLTRYREVCEAQIRRFARTPKEARANNLADMSTLIPGAVADPGIPVSMVEPLVARNPRSPAYLNTLGLALYRAGRFAEAVERLKAAEAEHSGPWNWIFLAMAEARLGRPDIAAGWLRKFDADPATRPSKDGPPGSSWENGLRYELFRREARTIPGLRDP